MTHLEFLEDIKYSSLSPHQKISIDWALDANLPQDEIREMMKLETFLTVTL